MNYRFDPGTLAAPGPVARCARQRGHERRERVANEVMAGFLWMSLDLPDDANLNEIKKLALDLSLQIQTGSDEAVIAAQLEYVQRNQLFRPVDPARILATAKRAVALFSHP